MHARLCASCFWCTPASEARVGRFDERLNAHEDAKAAGKGLSRQFGTPRRRLCGKQVLIRSDIACFQGFTVLSVLGPAAGALWVVPMEDGAHLRLRHLRIGREDGSDGHLRACRRPRRLGLEPDWGRQLVSNYFRMPRSLWRACAGHQKDRTRDRPGLESRWNSAPLGSSSAEWATPLSVPTRPFVIFTDSGRSFGTDHFRDDVRRR